MLNFIFKYVGEHEQNVIMWMDQRAVQETEVINALNHSAFQYVGGKVSIEMQLPKLLWLKRNLCDTWYQTKRFMDLSDFLTWKATNSDARYHLSCSKHIRVVHYIFKCFCLDPFAVWYANGTT
jgi:ribulose kinase